MKRLFAILLVAILATSFAMANNTPTGTGTVNVTVVEALTISNPTLQLPPIGLGDIHNRISTDTWDLVFSVTGSSVMTFNVTTIALQTPATGDPTLAITDLTTRSGLALTGGTATLTYPVTQIDASGAAVTVGAKTIQYKVTIGYDY